MVQTLNAQPSQQNTLSILMTVPWSFKLVYGFISDVLPIGGLRRKPYLVVGYFTSSLCYVALALTPQVIGRPRQRVAKIEWGAQSEAFEGGGIGSGDSGAGYGWQKIVLLYRKRETSSRTYPATGDLTLESHVDFRCLSCSEGAFCFPVEIVTKHLYRGLSFTDRSGWWVDRDSPLLYLSHDNCTGSRLPTTLSIGNDKLYAAFRLAVRLCSIFFPDVQGRVLLRSPQTFRV